MVKAAAVAAAVAAAGVQTDQRRLSAADPPAQQTARSLIFCREITRLHKTDKTLALLSSCFKYTFGLEINKVPIYQNVGRPSRHLRTATSAANVASGAAS